MKTMDLLISQNLGGKKNQQQQQQQKNQFRKQQGLFTHKEMHKGGASMI